MKADYRTPFDTLTVVIRDDSPMIFCDDSPAYRSIRIQLTDEQRAQIKLMYLGQSGATAYYEVLSKCFLEESDDGE